jgi:chromosome segregation protein
LLREFNDKSQFVIISHAKRTIGMANVLYGVTMGEPGVSKRISVRFEEVDRALDRQYQPVGT